MTETGKHSGYVPHHRRQRDVGVTLPGRIRSRLIVALVIGLMVIAPAALTASTTA